MYVGYLMAIKSKRAISKKVLKLFQYLKGSFDESKSEVAMF